MRFLHELTIGEMITITEQWTGAGHPGFVAIPELAPFLPRVQEDHDALLGARAGSSAEVPLRSLSEQADTLDTRHDHLQRALHLGMRSAREALLGQVPPNIALADAIDVALEKLQPRGLDIVKASYESEAGNAAQMVRLAETELALVLAQVPILDGVSALDLVKQIGAVGSALGAVEQKKSVTAAAAAKEEITPSEVRRRMRAWVDTIELVLGALTRTKGSEAHVEQIRKPVVDAAEKARARRLAKRNAAGKKGEGGPSEPGN
ncbi:hypothetical protein [Polyangium sorediatum]|uniref:Uncharacterized protein n=1 Tax=Polyangium sorediatum TaxID=889274 RepID=A0ABT6P816_9BACT|nr:hypothetical protein [Polyangium sorediatum]MDI1436769.1 hypothetical protein [Polyangium sorediatum]